MFGPVDAGLPRTCCIASSRVSTLRSLNNMGSEKTATGFNMNMGLDWDWLQNS